MTLSTVESSCMLSYKPGNVYTAFVIVFLLYARNYKTFQINLIIYIFLTIYSFEVYILHLIRSFLKTP